MSSIRLARYLNSEAICPKRNLAPLFSPIFSGKAEKMEPPEACSTYSRSRRPATDDTGSEKQIAPALVAGPACSLMARMIAAFSSACAII